jgi:hypothetical protein
MGREEQARASLPRPTKDQIRAARASYAKIFGAVDGNLRLALAELPAFSAARVSIEAARTAVECLRKLFDTMMVVEESQAEE